MLHKVKCTTGAMSQPHHSFEPREQCLVDTFIGSSIRSDLVWTTCYGDPSPLARPRDFTSGSLFGARSPTDSCSCYCIMATAHRPLCKTAGLRYPGDNILVLSSRVTGATEELSILNQGSSVIMRISSTFFIDVYRIVLLPARY